MTAAYNQGNYSPYDQSGTIRDDIFAIAANSKLVNRTPLFTRTPQMQLGSIKFTTSTQLFRPTFTPTASAYTASETSLVVVDASIFQTHDVVEVESEQMLVTAINLGTNTLTVVPAFAGTTSANHASGVNAYMVGNARTGGEVDVSGISRIPQLLSNYAQTFQFPWAIGGSLAAARDYVLPPGVQSAVGKERMAAIVNCSESAELAIYYSRPGDVTSALATPTMAGLRSQIVTNSILVTPTGYAAYTPDDLVRDAVQPCVTGGGAPDVMIVSTDFLTAFATWGMPLLRLAQGDTEFGVATRSFECPFLSGLEIILAPLLRPGTCITLTSDEFKVGQMRPMFDKPRGSRGDATEGDVIWQGSAVLEEEAHHSFVSGITGWAAS